jgi:hypothetical protein
VLIGALGTRQCGVGAATTFEAGRQYEVEFRFDARANRCVVSAAALEAPDGQPRRIVLQGDDKVCAS